MTVKSKAGVYWMDYYFKVYEVEDRFPTDPPIAYVKLERPSNWKGAQEQRTHDEVRRRAGRILGSTNITRHSGYYQVSTISKKELREKRNYHRRRLRLLAAVL